MKRFLLGLVPWMGLIATAGAAQVRSAEVLYTHFTAVTQRAFRLGDECFVPIEEVTTWGWTVTKQGTDIQIQAEGQQITVPCRVISDRQTIPMSVAMDKLHGGYDWVPETDTFEVFSLIDSIKGRDAKIDLTGPLAVQPSGYVLTNPNRIIIDLLGARLGPNTKQDFDVFSRAFQYKPNVVRVVVDTSFMPTPPPAAIPADSQFSFQIVAVPAPPIAAPTTTPVVTPPIAQPPQLSMTVAADTETETQFSVRLSHPTAAPVLYRKPDPSTLVVVLPGNNDTLPDGFKLTTDAVTQTELTSDAKGTTLTFHLKRPMGATVWTQDDMVQVQLLKPQVGNGKLAGKVVVVDPGHGGHDRGAHSFGVNEKDLTLLIGRQVANDLAAEGATVIMTRKTDVFIPLATRAEIANNNHADFFISCHINSTGGDGVQSGGIAFHHLGKGISRLLGECIQAQVAQVSKVPNLGVWSDGKIYRSGFSVLRNTEMPGVLMEFGFINCAQDCKRLCDPAFPADVARAVVKGLKDFLGDANTK